MHHQNFSDDCHLFPYDLIYEDLLNLAHHELDENHSTHDEEHDHHELVSQESIHDEVRGHHELVSQESIHDVVHDHHELVSQESTLYVVHGHHAEDVLVSIHVSVHDHHEQVFQESTLCEVILSLILHEKRFHLCERYGQQMIL